MRKFSFIGPLLFSLLILTIPASAADHQAFQPPWTIVTREQPIRSVTLEHRLKFHLPEKNEDHLLLYYVLLQYGRQPFQIVDINLKTGQVNVAEASPGRPGPQATILHADGKIYLGSGAPGFFLVYDPVAGQTRQIHRLADNGAQYISQGDDGAIYLGECVKGYVERYDPKDGSLENYGIIDDPGPPYYRYAYTLGSDGRYIYIAMGQMPWYLVILDRQTRSQKVFWKDPNNAYVGVFRGRDGGWYASRSVKNGPKTFYRLRGDTPEPVSQAPPGAPQHIPLGWPTPPAYEFDYSEAIPDSSTGGRATVRWRQQGTSEWRQASATLRLGPFDLKRLYPAPEGKLFGFTSFYGPVFTFDPRNEEIAILGRPQRSLYDALYTAGEWFLVGYPAATLRYDPKRPWNLGTPGTDLNDPLTNPRAVKGLASSKYHYYLAAGGDGFIYYGGHHERDARGGLLGWFHPQTGVSGSLREPFLEQDVSDLLAVQQGEQIVCSSRSITSGQDGKLFVFDVQTKTVLREIVPLAGQRDAGKLVEVEPGVVVGVSSGSPSSRVYKVDVRQGRLLWDKELAGRAFGNVRGYDRRLIKGPDGYLWLYVDQTICRLNPADGSLERLMAAPPAGNLLFYNRDLYIYGSDKIRFIQAILPNP